MDRLGQDVAQSRAEWSGQDEGRPKQDGARYCGRKISNANQRDDAAKDKRTAGEPKTL